MATYIVTDEKSARAANAAIQEEINRLMGKVEEEIPHTLRVYGKRVLQETIPLTPMLTGALRHSAKATVESEAGVYTLEVSFGDEEVNYAAIVHQRTHRNDGSPIRYTTPGTTHHYLQIGGNKVADNEGVKIFVDELKSRIGS